MSAATFAIRSLPIRQKVAEVLRRALKAGEFKPGEDLNEVQLATKFQVSRGPIREALLQLAEEGLVTHSPNRGFAVLIFTKADLAAIGQVRLPLEATALELAREKATPTSLGQLEKIMTRLLSLFQDDRKPARDEAEIEFHRSIWLMSGNPWLVNALDRIMVPYFTYSRAFDLGNHQPDQRLMAERHQLYLDYLAGRTDMSAIDCVRFHLGLIAPTG
jgi:DNA-binding GntR family transcriptional regulator